MVKETSPAYRITDFSPTDRPRERLAEKGPGALSDAELLAILLRVGMEGENAVQMGQRILAELDGLHGLHRATFQELCKLHGLKAAKAAQIMAAIELGKRISEAEPKERAAIHSPKDAADMVRYEMQALEVEHLWVMLLDTRNRWLETQRLYVGSLNSSTVRVGELFRGAIQRNAASIILIHNHPSGDPSPSPEDVTLTRSAVQAGKNLDIAVLDHLIIGVNSWVSLKEKGLGFS